MSHSNQFSALLIDDEEMARETFELSLSDYWTVTCLPDISPLLEHPEDLHSFDVIFLDMVFLPQQPVTVTTTTNLSPTYGLSALSWIKARRKDVPIFIHSGLDQRDYTSSIIKENAHIFYAPKPTLFDDEFRLQVEVIVKETKNTPSSP